MRNIRTAVIGIGNMGSAHAACILNGDIAGMTLAAVCDVDSDKRLGFDAAHPDILVYDDYLKMLENDDIDAVIIAVPHRLHADIAEKALCRGKHVLVEKPVDISVSKAITLNAAARIRRL